MTSKKKGDSQSFIESIVDFGQRKVNNLVKDYIEEKITKQLVRIGEISLAFFIGIVLVIVGVAQYLAYLLSILENGLNYILLGCVLLLVAYFISERK